MIEKWKFNRFRDRLKLAVFLFAWISFQSFAFSLNDEGLALLRFKERVESDPLNALSEWREESGEANPCSWFGVGCSEGNVVVLNLKDLHLGGTLGSELALLSHIKSIILRNNSFTGVIPEGIGELKELQELDFGFNNFSGPIPRNLGCNLLLTIISLDNNGLIEELSPKLREPELVSALQIVEESPKVRNLYQAKGNRRMMQGVLPGGEPQAEIPTPVEPDNGIAGPVSPSQSPSSSEKAAASPSKVISSPPRNRAYPAPAPSSSPPPPVSASSPVPTTPTVNNSSKSSNRAAIVAGVVGASVAIVAAIAVYICFKTKVTYVNPWATGLSGQLKKALVTGVPKLKRSELETACEDFSNVIGPSSIGTLYKGTLSSGVEIAVAIVTATTLDDWSENQEIQFLKKIDSLSKLNHKNFVNLIGYCQEDEPFTRMMVFEYAPNGTLFEHLHIREAEHLDWGMRLRVAMGMAYCLDYMHQLEQPIPHNNLNASAIRLTEDYAAKIAEFTFRNEIAAEPTSNEKLAPAESTSPECNVYSFGVILFEMVTGRVPYSVDNVSLEDWAADYLQGQLPLKDMIDPIMSSYDGDQVEEISHVIRACVNPDPSRRPAMRDICIRLREVTGITPDGASPRISPLWWAELELMSDAV